MKHGSDCILFDLARPGPKSGSQQTFAVDATRQFVGWREGFLRAPHGGKTDNSVVNTLLPGGGKMAGGALAAGCHARQLGNIHLGTGAVVRPLAGRILVNTAAFSALPRATRASSASKGPCRWSSDADPRES